MKKLFLAFALLASVALVGCEESVENGDNTEVTYTLTITPATASVGDTVTMTVSGDDADDYSWQACYSSTTDSTNNGCWSYNDSSSWTYTVSLGAGEYKIYASSKSGDHTTSKATFTVTE